MISVVINADTRRGFNNDTSLVGEFENGQPNGTRSVDFLTEGIKQKIRFFDGYEIQVILCIDKHEDIKNDVWEEMMDIVSPCSNNSQIIFKTHDRKQYKWNDKIYIEALKLAEGDFVVHFDGDTNAYRNDNCDIVGHYLFWLDNGYRYVCQPWDGMGDEMFWASTRFFICKKETLDIPLIENSLGNPLLGRHNPCLEHTLGILAGPNRVLYPKRDDDNYIIFSWATYHLGTIKKLNEMNYEDVKKYIQECGLFGTNDVSNKIPVI